MWKDLQVLFSADNKMAATQTFSGGFSLTEVTNE
jgi:hypothetical protein